MEKEQYEILFNLEDTYWWHVGLRKLLISTIISNTKSKTKLRILDAGCGTGGNLVELKKLGYAVGIDLADDAILFSKQRGIDKLIKASLSELPCKDNYFDAIISVDVLYHQQIKDDVTALQELFRVLKKDGLLMLHLPAFEFLRGSHDTAVHTKRRYIAKDVKKILISLGFKVKKITYRNFILFFVAFFLRKLNRKKGGVAEFRPLPEWINRIFISLTNIENSLIRNIDIPLGVSIFCIAAKE